MIDIKKYIALGLAVISGLLLAAILLSGLVLAQGSASTAVNAQVQRFDTIVADVQPTQTAYWLVLDPARPVDEILPLLEQVLNRLRAGGKITRFDLTPRQSASGAVSAVQVLAEAEAYDVLRRLPGVLDAVQQLPPPPSTGDELRTLRVTGTITGVVTDAQTGQPLAASVYVYDAASFAPIGNDYTDAQGRYEAHVTAPYGQAKVFATTYQEKFAPEWYNDKAYFSEADPIVLQPGSTVGGIDLALDYRGMVSVTLIPEEGDVTPRDAWVDLVDMDNDWIDYCDTDARGQCAMYVDPGTYKLYFDGYTIDPEWYQDQTSFSTATPVVVTTNMTTNITAQVGVFGCISGTLSSYTGTLSVDSFEVVLYQRYQNGGLDPWYYTTVYLGGGETAYQVCGLDAGDYVVGFSAFPLVTTWYSDTVTLGDAAVVTVVTGTVTPDINGAAGDVLGACVLGRIVTDASQEVNAGFMIFDEHGHPFPFWSGQGYVYLDWWGYTNDDGGFVACGLPAGTYTITVDLDYPIPDFSTSFHVAAQEVKDLGDVMIYYFYLPLLLRDAP